VSCIADGDPGIWFFEKEKNVWVTRIQKEGWANVSGQVCLID